VCLLRGADCSFKCNSAYHYPLKGEMSKYVGLKFTLRGASRSYRNTCIVKVNKSVAEPKVFCERNKFAIQSGAFMCVFTSIKWKL